MRLMDRRQQSGRSGNSLAFCGLAISLIGGTLIAAPLPALAVELRATRCHRFSQPAALRPRVVDMWPRGYLQPPDVMTVEKWVKEH